MWLSQQRFSSVQSLSCVRLFATPWITARQASLSITSSRSSLRLTSIESVIPSSHLILCCPLLLLPSIPPSIRVFSNESTLRMRWPKYWSFSFSIIPFKEIPGLIFPTLLFCKYIFLSFQDSFIQQHVAGALSLTLYNYWLHSCCRKGNLWAFHFSPSALSWEYSPWTLMLEKASPSQLCLLGSKMCWLKVDSLAG